MSLHNRIATKCNHWFDSSISAVETISSSEAIQECILCGEWFLSDIGPDCSSTKDMVEEMIRRGTRTLSIKKRY